MSRRRAIHEVNAAELRALADAMGPLDTVAFIELPEGPLVDAVLEERAADDRRRRARSAARASARHNGLVQ